MSDIDSDPHALIRALRGRLKMTQAQLAARAGLPQSHVARIEAGKVDARLGTLRRIFSAMSFELSLVLDRRETLRAPTAPRRTLQVRIADRKETGADLEFWLSKPAWERIEAVEFLREQYYALSGHKALPRLARSLRLEKRSA